ncbi:MAG: T9SS type A sorting domain-containing protein [Bacteroidales bacterium]|nr:T9SS type A sorting domain-containing protein [Bacteroidales bacterium]
MKKVLSFALALALVGVCFGQVTITHNGNNVAAGATIEISTDEYGDDVEFISFDIVNGTSNSINMKVVTTEADPNGLSIFSVCTAGSCVPRPSSIAFDLAAGSTMDVQVHAKVPSNTPTNTAGLFNIKIEDQSDNSSLFSFQARLTFIGTPVSIATVDGETMHVSAYPNPATSMVTVSYTVEGDGAIVLHDVMGRKVMSQRVSGTGTTQIDVTNLPKGIYLYGVESGNRQSAKNKLVVK